MHAPDKPGGPVGSAYATVETGEAKSRPARGLLAATPGRSYQCEPFGLGAAPEPAFGPAFLAERFLRHLAAFLL